MQEFLNSADESITLGVLVETAYGIGMMIGKPPFIGNIGNKEMKLYMGMIRIHSLSFPKGFSQKCLWTR